MRMVFLLCTDIFLYSISIRKTSFMNTWKSIKNFGRGIATFFTPLGIFAFAFIICLCVVVPGIINIAKETLDEVDARMIENTYDWNIAKDYFIGNVASSGFTSVGDLFNDFWVFRVLEDTVIVSFGLKELSADVSNILKGGVDRIGVLLVVALIVLIFSIIFGFVWIKTVMRKRLTNDKYYRLILLSLLDSFVFVLVLFIIILVDYFSRAGMIGMLIFSFFLIVGFSLVEAYLFYARKKVKFREVFPLKDLLFLILGDLAICLICAGISILLLYTVNTFLMLLIAIPLFEVGICIVSLNAESMVTDDLKERNILAAPKKEKKKKEKKAKEKAGN